MTATVEEVIARLPDPALAEADWADAYEAEAAVPFARARAAAEAAVHAFPRWTLPLLALRNLVVLPLRLKGAERRPGRDMVGIFPVVSDTPSRFVGGFDDRHLDFRVIVDLLATGNGRQRVRLTTVIRRHNLAGRAYLRAVLPFHRAIIRQALARIASGRGDD